VDAAEVPETPKPKAVAVKPKAKAAKAKASPKSTPKSETVEKLPKAKATPKSKTAAKSASKKPSLKRPAGCDEVGGGGGAHGDEEPGSSLSSSVEPPPRKVLKATKYMYHKDKKWGVKLNGKEMCTVGVWQKTKCVFYMNFNVRRSLQVWFRIIVPF